MSKIEKQMMEESNSKLTEDHLLDELGEIVVLPEDRSDRLMAILEVSSEMFRELFQLPAGCEVMGINVPFNRPGVIEIGIRGAGWPTPLGNCVQHTTGIVHRARIIYGEVMDVIDWKMPR